MYSPHMLTPHNIQDVQEDAIRTWVMQWPPLPAHVKAVLIFGIQVPFKHSSHICVDFFFGIHSGSFPRKMAERKKMFARDPVR